MDPDSSIARVERTFWAVWSYISGAVNRLIRSEPTNISNEPNTLRPSAVDTEPADHGHLEGDTSGGSVDEEQPLATASLLSSSHAVVAWDLCTNEKSMRYEPQMTGDSESKASEEGEDMREEQFSQTGCLQKNDDTGLLITKDAGVKEENGDHKLQTHRQNETPDNDEYGEYTIMGLLNLTDEVMSEDIEGNKRKVGAEEAPWAMTPDDHQKMDETKREIQSKEKDDNMYHEDDQDLKAEDTEKTLCRMTDFSLAEEHNVYIGDSSVQIEETVIAVMHEEVENSGSVSQLALENENKYEEGEKKVENLFSACEELSKNDRDVKEDPGLTSLNDELHLTSEKIGNVSEDVGREHVMAHRGESDKVVDEREEEDESALNEREQGGEVNVSEDADSQAKDEEPEQEEDIKTVTQDNQGIFADIVTHSDVLVTDEKSHVATTDIPIDERFFDKDQVAEERLTTEKKDNKDGYMEIACAANSVTVKPEGESGQEIIIEFPLGMYEGQVVKLWELNSSTCEETQEGVPEYNNEPEPDENTTQRFLEVGDSRQFQAYQLPEEVESTEPQSLQNSGTGDDYLLVREHIEEKQESTEDIKEHTGILQFTDTRLPEEIEKLLVEPVIEESGHLFEEEEGKLLDSSMKTGTEYSEREFETHDVREETDKTAKELQEGTEELLVEFDIDEGLSDSRDAAGDGRETTGAVAAEDLLVGFADENFKILEADVQKMTEMSLFQESVDEIETEQNGNKTLTLPEDIIQCGFLKQLDETEPKLLEESTVEMQDAGIDMEETGCGVEEEAVEDKMKNKNEMDILNLKVAGIAAELATETNQNILFAESELSRPDESVEKKNELSDKAFEISNEEMLIDTEASDELMTNRFKPKDFALIPAEEMEKHVREPEGSYTEETSSLVSRCQDVIDEERGDFLTETALLKDMNGVKQEEPEPGLMYAQIESLNKEQDEIPSVQAEEEKEQLVESNSGESGLVSDTEMSSSTTESGFLDQSVIEWGTDQSETQLLKSTSAGSFQSLSDMLDNMSESADISELSAQRPTTIFHPDSGVISSEADEKRVEPAETENGSQRGTDADWRNTEVADVETLEKTSTLISAEKTKVEDALLEVTGSDPPDDLKETQMGQSKGGSEALLQEEIMLTESQDNTFIKLEKLQKLPSLDKPHIRETEDQVEVDGSALDFTAQKSRIAVKNPRVRPPKDPHSLLHMPSLDPTPSSHQPVKILTGVPLGGVGIGIKLPGLGGGLPVLKKTPVMREEKNSETLSEEPETKPEEKFDTAAQDEEQRKPKWMPPRHPGFGNPLMSELKTKLKKTTKE